MERMADVAGHGANFLVESCAENSGGRGTFMATLAKCGFHSLKFLHSICEKTTLGRAGLGVCFYPWINRTRRRYRNGGRQQSSRVMAEETGLLLRRGRAERSNRHDEGEHTIACAKGFRYYWSARRRVEG